MSLDAGARARRASCEPRGLNVPLRIAASSEPSGRSWLPAAPGRPGSHQPAGRRYHRSLIALIFTMVMCPVMPARVRTGRQPAEIAARAGHSIHVLLSVYAHCAPGHEHIASPAIEHVLALPGPGIRPAAHRRAAGSPCGPPLAPEMPSLPTLAPSARRPAHSYTQ